MTRNRAKIRANYITTAIKIAKLKIRIINLMATIYYLRFGYLRIITKMMMAIWSYLTAKLIDTTKIEKKHGEKPWCPFCAIPLIGTREYIKTNTKAVITAPIKQMENLVWRFLANKFMCAVYLALQTFIHSELNLSVELTVHLFTCIVGLHKSLKPYGYELAVGDIIDGYPLGEQPRGQTAVPVVITYKDEKTTESVRAAAKKAGLWDERKLNKKDGQQPKGFFTAAYDSLGTVYLSKHEIRDAIRQTKRYSGAGPDGLKMTVYSEACLLM